MRATSLMDPTTQNLPNSSENLQNVDLKSNCLHFSRSRVSLIPEEPSPGASLMARDLSLGPSDAPCPVETSTVHGDSFFSTTDLTTKKDKFYWISVSASDLDRSLLISRSPEMSTSLLISPPSPVSRRPHIPSWSTKEKLGFLLRVGLIFKSGPLILIRPNPISCNLTSKTRSVVLFPLSILSQCLCRSIDLSGRRHHLRNRSPLLLWFYNHLLRTLDLIYTMAMSNDSKRLKIYGLSNDSKHQTNVNVYKRSIMFYQEVGVCDVKDHEPPFSVLKQAVPDYKTVVNRNFAVVLLRVDLLVPARITVLVSSLTSPRLLTVTILSSFDSFMEDCSTNRDLTCVKTLHSLCLKALMEPMSIYLIYLFMALGNAFLCYILNFGMFEVLFLLVLV